VREKKRTHGAGSGEAENEDLHGNSPHGLLPIDTLVPGE
jgi:hypothetical protein